MQGRGCLAIRWGAYGDLIFALPIFEYLKRKYGYLHLETTPQGKDLFQHHPSFDAISTFKVWEFPDKEQAEVSFLRWAAMEDCSWEHTINLWRTLEVGCIAEEFQEEFWYPRERRRVIFGGNSFHEAPWIKAGVPIPDPFDCGTIYFPEDILWWMKSWRERHKDEFVIAIPVRGHPNAPQKQPVGLKELSREILGRYPTAKLWLMGDKIGKDYEFDFGDGRVNRTCGTMSYLHALAIMKMVDFAVGAESSLLVGAGLFGTPKSALCTSSGVDQITRYHKNDFSIQSGADCSPCHRAVYKPDYCVLKDFGRGDIPACNGDWNKERILEGVEFAWKCKVSGVRETVELFDGPGFGSLPDLQPLLDSKTDRDEEVQLGVLPEVRELCSDAVRVGDQPLTVGNDYEVSEW